MSTDPTPSLILQPRHSIDVMNGGKLRSSDAEDGVLQLQGSPNGSPSVTITIPRVIHNSVLIVSSTLSKLFPMERHDIMPIVAVVFAETAFLKCIGRSGKDILSVVFFTALLARLVWPVWCSLNRVHCRLDKVFARVEALQQSIKSLESRPIGYVLEPVNPNTPPVLPREDPSSKPSVDPEAMPDYECLVGPPVVTNGPLHPPYDISSPEPVATPVAVESPPPAVPPTAPLPDSSEGVQLERLWNNIAEAPNVPAQPVIPPTVVKNPPALPPTAPELESTDGVCVEGLWGNIAEAPNVPTHPAVIKNPPTAPPTAPEPESTDGVHIEGLWGNIAEVPNLRSQPVPPAIIKNPPTVPAAPEPDSVDGVHLEGLWGNIAEVPNLRSQPAIPSVASPASCPDRGGVKPQGMNGIVREAGVGIASGSTARPASTTETGFSRWSPTLREIKLQILQFTEGRIERISHLSQSESSIYLSLRRWGVRLLMSAASLSPADFAPPIGYLGTIESTPYYPTGDIRGDRNVAFTIAMDCLDDLAAYLNGDDEIRIATKLLELAQALSDLGLREYALNTSDFALEALERPYVTAPNNTRLHLASILSLRANILCDLKRNDEAKAAADRAVTISREHQDSQSGPVPELAYSLLNYAVLLDSINHKDESAAVAFELCVDDSQSDMKDITALCKLCLSNTRIGADNDMALSVAEEVIELTLSSPDAISQTVLVGALLNKSKVLSSRRQNDVACTVSAEAVTVLRTMTDGRPVFSLFLAHALDTHAHHLSEANRKGESYSIQRDAAEHWQTLKTSAGGAVTRPLAWSTFELAKFRRQGADRDARREEFQIAESAVDMFRQIEPLDAPGLGEALYLYADRMLELDNNREAATYAEESVHYFLEASSKDPKYALDLIFSLSLASSCLACTERANDAFEYAKQAVEVQHGRKDIEDEHYNAHLRKLLMDVVFRATEMDRQEEGFPWFQELQALGGLGEESGEPLQRRSGNSQDKGDRFKKQTSHWIDIDTNAPRSNDGSASSPVGSSSTLRVDKGKGKEVAPTPEAESYTARVDKGKGKAKEVDPLFDSSALRHRPADEEIMSPGAAAAVAAQRRLAGLGPLQGIAGGNDLLNGSFGMGMGGRTLGGSGIPGLGMSGLGMRGTGGLGRLGPDGQSAGVLGRDRGA